MPIVPILILVIVFSFIYILYLNRHRDKLSNNYPASKKRLLAYLVLSILHIPMFIFTLTVFNDTRNASNLQYQLKKYHSKLSGYYFPTTLPPGYSLGGPPYTSKLTDFTDPMAMDFGKSTLKFDETIFIKQSKITPDFNLQSYIKDKAPTATLVTKDDKPDFIEDIYKTTVEFPSGKHAILFLIKTEDNLYISTGGVPSLNPPTEDQILEFIFNLKKVN